MTPDQLADILRALGYGSYVPLLLAVIGLAAKIAAVAPPATTNSSAAWRVFRAGLDLAAGNWGNARNVNVAVAIMPAASSVGVTGVFGLLALVLSLGACAAAVPAPQTAQQAIYVAAATYEGALALAADYTSLPACVPSVSALCADAAAVKKIANVVASTSSVITTALALAGSDGADPVSLQRSLAAVNAAVSALSSIQSGLQVAQP